MKSMRKRTARITSAALVVFCCCALLLACVPAAQAAGMTASVVTGPVTLNGQKVDNAGAEYPLLLYRNITYFPMTYHLSRFMGVSTDWDNASRTLKITASGEHGAYVADHGHAGTSGTVAVSVPDYAVYVNNARVDNQQENWPVLNYRGVTYFPLTWHYAVECFGWGYEYDAANGLRIDTTKAAAPASSAVSTGDRALDAALEILGAGYLAGGSYSGSLTGPKTKELFAAKVAVVQSASDIRLTLTAEPFVFFPSGQSLEAIYYVTQGGLAGQPLMQSVISVEEFGELPAETEPERGYIGRCFLDCQFAGARSGRINSSRQLPQTEKTHAVWELSVTYADEAYPGFTGYTAQLSVDLEKNTLDWLQITVKDYTLRMTPPVAQ